MASVNIRETGHEGYETGKTSWRTYIIIVVGANQLNWQKFHPRNIIFFLLYTRVSVTNVAENRNTIPPKHDVYSNNRTPLLPQIDQRRR